MPANSAVLEHVNLTVSDPRKTAEMLVELFGWHIRWEGPSQLGGFTVHVGNDQDYLAVYAPTDGAIKTKAKSPPKGRLNHLGITVNDLDATEKRVNAFGFETFNHGNYEPGRRFYFLDHDGVEYEIVSYQS